MSRGRQTNRLYMVENAAKLRDEFAPRVCSAAELELAANARQSRGQLLALDTADEPLTVPSGRRLRMQRTTAECNDRAKVGTAAVRCGDRVRQRREIVEKNHNARVGRLEHEFSALAVAIEHATSDERRRVAVAVATAAVEATGLNDAAVAEAIKSLSNETLADRLRDRVERTVTRLDEEHWDAEDALASLKANVGAAAASRGRELSVTCARSLAQGVRAG